MGSRKNHQIVIQASIVLVAIFASMVAVVAYYTGSYTMGLIFLSAVQLIVLLAILFVLETISELVEER
jgi:hypothetical protein